MNEYEATIGLEIHVELKTKTKMFCNSINNPDEVLPNVNICPVCLAHPGTLPVINKEAVAHVLRVGCAIGGTLADYTEFDRKNYFYPDLPKGYQISQYEYPLVSGGILRDVAVTRIHLEEDTASSMHYDGSVSLDKTPDKSVTAGERSGETHVDYNRAGVPLMELVTEPVIKSAAQAGAFARELQLLLRYLDVSEANMEKGQMRVEANISIRKIEDVGLDGAYGVLGTKVEIKNLNSFRAMERAVEYEIIRQQQVLESGEEVIQETRGWDEGKQSTFAQRIKEGSADYRYFPDPDLPSLKISEIPEFNADILAKALPELPWNRRARYLAAGIQAEDAELYTRSLQLGAFFDDVVRSYEAPELVRLASNYIANDLSKILKDLGNRDTEIIAKIPISSDHFRKIIELLAAKKISSRSAKDLLGFAVSDDRDPEVVAQEKGLFQSVSVDDISAAIRGVLENNASVVSEFKTGKQSALEYLVGQCMKSLRGAADPGELRALIQKKIS